MTIAIQNRQKKHSVDMPRLRRSVKRLLKELHREDCDISLLLVDDRQIREINRTFLDRDRPTNVISFSMKEGEFCNVHPELLGDIILSVETAFRDAKTGQLGFMDEIEFLVIHGLLHLLGFNHENTSRREAGKMKARERELFSFLRHYNID